MACSKIFFIILLAVIRSTSAAETWDRDSNTTEVSQKNDSRRIRWELALGIIENIPLENTSYVAVDDKQKGGTGRTPKRGKGNPQKNSSKSREQETRPPDHLDHNDPRPNFFQGEWGDIKSKPFSNKAKSKPRSKKGREEYGSLYGIRSEKQKEQSWLAPKHSKHIPTRVPQHNKSFKSRTSVKNTFPSPEENQETFPDLTTDLNENTESYISFVKTPSDVSTNTPVQQENENESNNSTSPQQHDEWNAEPVQTEHPKETAEIQEPLSPENESSPLTHQHDEEEHPDKSPVRYKLYGTKDKTSAVEVEEVININNSDMQLVSSDGVKREEKIEGALKRIFGFDNDVVVAHAEAISKDSQNRPIRAQALAVANEPGQVAHAEAFASSDPKFNSQLRTSGLESDGMDFLIVEILKRINKDSKEN